MKRRRALRIGLTQRVEDVAGRGERRDALDQAWAALLTELGFVPLPVPNAHPAPAAFVDQLELDGIVLTGGNDLVGLPGATDVAPERDDVERALIEACVVRDVPVLGVCRGMQMLATAWGATLVAVSGHAGAQHALHTNGPTPLPVGPRDAVSSFHRFAVARDGLAGADLIAAAWAPDGSVEALVHRRLPQWGIMWHPERGPADERDRLVFERLFGRRPCA